RVPRRSPASATAPYRSHRRMSSASPFSRARRRPTPRRASRAPKPRDNVRTPAVLASRPTHVAAVSPGRATRLAPTAMRPTARLRARSRSSISGLLLLLLHEPVAEAGGGCPQGGLGIDIVLAGERHHAEQQLAESGGVGGVSRRHHFDAGGGRLALHLVGVEQRGQVARDPVHDAGPALLGLLDLLPVAHDLPGRLG